MPTEFSVSEDVPIGHVVTTVKVTDPDTPTRITFSLIAGDREKFHLDADTGVLSLTDLLDRETKSKHKLIVQANDGIQKTEATFTITMKKKSSNNNTAGRAASSENKTATFRRVLETAIKR
ncbi:Protocadherin Fat 4, partial [Sarracenia purpurea var. burkii]